MIILLKIAILSLIVYTIVKVKTRSLKKDNSELNYKYKVLSQKHEQMKVKHIDELVLLNNTISNLRVTINRK